MTAELNLTFYDIKDRPDIYEIAANHHWIEWEKLYRAWGFQSSEDIIKKWLKPYDDFTRVFVCFTGSHFIGTVSAVNDDMPGLKTDLTPWLSVLFIVPEFRLKGLAKHLINHCKKYLSDLGYSKAYLWAEKEHLESVYSKLGWNTIERVHYCGYNAPIMKIEL